MEVILDVKDEDFIFNSSTGSYISFESDWFCLEEGQDYLVIWDGVEYSVKAFRCLYNGADTIILGNEQFVKGESANTVEPFIIGRNLSNNMCSIITLDTAPTHTVAIYKVIDGNDGNVTY